VTTLPSLLDGLPDLRSRLTPEPATLIALDFDGTLTEIVDDHAAPRLTPGRRDVLARVVRSGRHLAIVSGRRVEDVHGRVGVAGAVYAGNHGLEIEGPTLHERPADHEELATRVTRLLEGLPALEGALVENKGITATVHVRPPDDEDRIAGVGAALQGPAMAAGLELRRGRASWEIRPSGPTKGDAVRRLLEALAVREERTLYVGDDATDEDAFREIARGITARVGPAGAETAAAYAVASPDALYAFLTALLEG
jgi:trehalose-phosphatase